MVYKRILFCLFQLVVAGTLFGQNHPNKFDRYDGPFMDGLKNGNFKICSEFNQFVCEGSYSNDTMIGAWKFYHENTGKIISKGNYLNGLKSGEWEMYSAKGTVTSGNYIDGKKVGEWKTIRNDSIFEFSFYNENGAMQGYSFTKFDDGSVKQEIVYDNWQPTDSLRIYYPNGILRAKCDFGIGEVDTTYEYNIDGELDYFHFPLDSNRIKLVYPDGEEIIK